MPSITAKRLKGVPMAIRARERPEGARSSQRVVQPARRFLEGALDQIGVATVLTIVEMERRSGVLRLRQGLELGCIFFRDGRVVRAWVEGDESHTGAEAVYRLLGWLDGEFQLCQTDADTEDEVQMPTALLLMEAARRQDESKAAGALPG